MQSPPNPEESGKPADATDAPDLSQPAENNEGYLVARRLGIHTYQEPIAYMRADSHVCRAEGFEAQSRVSLSSGGRSTVATLNIVTEDFLSHAEIGLSEAAWRALGCGEGDSVVVNHARPAESMSYVRGKLYGKRFNEHTAEAVIRDVTHGIYSDIQLSAFLTACAGSRLSTDEIIALTRAMVVAGETLSWPSRPIMDKHCVGGLPGNRTTPLVVAIVAAAGLAMPKTSSRAITSPAGTADTMETLAPVNLSMAQLRDVVDREGGCIAWGGSVSLSPADDILIRVERALDLDSEGQLVASVISKKVAAGSSHVLLDVPVGLTAKVRSEEYAQRLTEQLKATGEALGLRIRCHLSDGSQPIGQGIGPALEARDVLQVFQCEPQAPADLRKHALILAGLLLEMGGKAPDGKGFDKAAEILESGLAWRKFQAICEAQGGMRTPPSAAFQHPVCASRAGIVSYINNRFVSRLAKLAGAPADPAAGLDFHVKLGQKVEPDTPLFTIHAESQGELAYALDFLNTHPEAVRIEEEGL